MAVLTEIRTVERRVTVQARRTSQPSSLCRREEGATGLTTAQARERGLDVARAVIDLHEAIARPVTYGKDIGGRLGLVADRKRGVLVGAWALSPEAGEWIHLAVLAIRAAIPIPVLRDVIEQFPTFSEAYLSGLEMLAV